MSRDSSISQLLVHKMVNNDLRWLFKEAMEQVRSQGSRRPEDHLDLDSQEKHAQRG